MQLNWPGMIRLCRLSALGGAMAISGTVAAQEPLIDAGNQAMIMHQGDLLEQQTAPNNAHTNDRSAHARAASPACSLAEEREKLRPEYERRVRADGLQAATAWLRQQAGELGRQAGLRMKAGQDC
jgi:hypothetical protein